VKRVSRGLILPFDSDTNWDFRTLDTATVELGITINPAGMDVSIVPAFLAAQLTSLFIPSQAVNPDITPFAGKGGKLLQYVGWADELIAPGNSVRLSLCQLSHRRSHSQSSVPSRSNTMTRWSPPRAQTANSKSTISIACSPLAAWRIARYARSLNPN
jgi:hypothetical protein